MSIPDEHLEAAADLIDRQKTNDSLQLLSAHATIDNVQSLSKMNRGQAKYRRSQAVLLDRIGLCLAALTLAAIVLAFLKWS